MGSIWRNLLAIIALSFILAVLTGPVVAQQRTGTDVLTAFTEPSKRLEMNFPMMGIIRKVSVKDGDLVKRGQLLMAQDDDIEAAEFDRLKAEAESQARMEFALASLEVKRKEYQRKTDPKNIGAFSASEIEQAQLDVTQAEKQIDVVKLDQRGNVLKARQQEIRVNKMKLLSEIDGLVEGVKVWEGELSTPQADRPSIIVVKNDPCYVVLTTLRSAQAGKLHLGDAIQVRYPDESDWREAKVSYIAPVARAESDMRIVKLELPNAEGRATGLQIQVKLPPQLMQ